MYTITDLETLIPNPLAKSHAIAINDAGQVVGYSDFGDYDNTTNTFKIFHAFLWDSGEIFDLHDPNWSWPTSIALSINNTTESEVVGGTVRIDQPPHGDAFYYYNTLSKSPTMLDIGPKGWTSIARGINDNRQIVGHQYRFWGPGGPGTIALPYQYAIFWPLAGEAPMGLPPLVDLFSPNHPLESKAAAINGDSTIVGRADIDALGNFQACMWVVSEVGINGNIIAFMPQPLATPAKAHVGKKVISYAQSYAWAINDNAPPQMVGVYGDHIGGGTSRFACAWSMDGEVKPLFPNPPPLSFAFDINNNGDMVGTFVGPNGPRAFYCTSYWPKPLDLTGFIKNNPGWILTAARGINNKGQIVGEGIIGGKTHAFLMTPSFSP